MSSGWSQKAVGSLGEQAAAPLATFSWNVLHAGAGAFVSPSVAARGGWRPYTIPHSCHFSALCSYSPEQSQWRYSHGHGHFPTETYKQQTKHQTVNLKDSRMQTSNKAQVSPYETTLKFTRFGFLFLICTKFHTHKIGLLNHIHQDPWIILWEINENVLNNASFPYILC